MKTNGKAAAAAGIAAGVLTAAVPAALGFIASRGGEQTSPRPEKIACDGYGFSTTSGENVKLRILSVRNFTPGVDEREKLFSRFGAYGAAQICAEYEKSVLTDGDLEYIAGLGFNCVLVSFSYTLIYPNGVTPSTHHKQQDDNHEKTSYTIPMHCASIGCRNRRSPQRRF